MDSLWVGGSHKEAVVVRVLLSITQNKEGDLNCPGEHLGSDNIET